MLTRRGTGPERAEPGRPHPQRPAQNPRAGDARAAPAASTARPPADTSSTSATARPTPIRVAALPVTVLPDQLAYIHFVSLTIHNALKRLPELYMQDFAVRDVLRITPDEEKWLWDCWGPSQRENNPIFGRLDAMVDFISPMWKDSLRFVEPNLSGIGGLHLVPTCERIVADVVLPVLQRARPAAAPGTRPGHPRAAHAGSARPSARRSAGRRATSASSSRSTPAAAPTSRKRWPSIYHDRYGLKVMHADPAELTLQRRRGLLQRRRGRPGLPRLRRRRPARAGAGRRRRRADAGAVSSRTASSRRSRRSWIRRAAGRC